MDAYDNRQSNYELEMETFQNMARRQVTTQTLRTTMTIPSVPRGLRQHVALVFVHLARGLWTLLREPKTAQSR